jgi:hypothetical protein
MTKKSNLFGAAARELDAARSALEMAIGAAMERHESEYRGGDYFLLEKDGAKLVLQANFTEDDGEVTEAQFPDAGVLLYVDGESSAVDGIVAFVAERLSSFRLLRSSSY